MGDCWILYPLDDGTFLVWVVPFDSVQYHSEESRQVVKTKEIQSLEGTTGMNKYLWTTGQQIIVYGGMGYRKITKIDRITDGRDGTIYVGKDAFDKHGSMRGGDIWNRSHIVPATEKEIQEIRDLQAIRKLESFNWLTIPGWLANSIVEFMAKDSRVNFKEGKFIPNPEG